MKTTFKESLKEDHFKAGCIPYIKENGSVKMLFIISSNANFGGIDPAIIKGNRDDDESPLETALREMKEEVGIHAKDIVKTDEIFDGKISGLVSSYRFIVYGCLLKQAPELKIDTFEIAEAVWLTLDEFRQRGRKSHLKIVEQMAKL
jgi:8-oxo-dGTP pyrophosphatase MutT (NUDIX family)